MSDTIPIHWKPAQYNLTPIRPLTIPLQSNDSPDSILQNIPQKKRRRGKRSCNACRQRRMKCNADTVQPCSGCKQFGVECHFRDEKGPIDPIKSFEDRIIRLEGLLNRTLDRRRAKRTHVPVEESQTSAFFEGCVQSLVCGYKAGLVSSDATLELVERMNLLQLRDYGTTRYIGSSSGVQLLDPFINSECYRVKGERSFFLQKVNNNDDEIVVVKAEGIQRSPTHPRITQSITALNDIPGLTEELVDLALYTYFAFIQPTFPIINKLSFLQQYYYQNPDPPDKYMLSAMCAIGMDFLNFQDGLVVGTNISHETVYSVKRTLVDEAAKILRIAHRRSQISTLQTLILLTTFLTLSNGADDEEDSIHWITTGIAINMAQELGLHRSSTKWNIPESEIELRRRIWYAIYIVDIWMAAELGRPTAISDDIFDVELPSVYENGSIYNINNDKDVTVSHPPLVTQAESSLRTKSPEYGFFLHLVLLSRILRRVLSLLYPQRAYATTRNDNEIIDGLDAELGAWKSNLPAYLRFNGVDHDIFSTGDSALLHVFYNCVVILLQRPLLEDPDFSGTVNSILSHRVCTTAALNIMYTMDALMTSVSYYIPRSIMGYSVFQAARVFAFNAGSKNEYERHLGFQNLAHCTKTYIIDEAYIQNSRIVNQLTNLLAELHLYKVVTQSPGTAMENSKPSDLVNQRRSKIHPDPQCTRPGRFHSDHSSARELTLSHNQHFHHHSGASFTHSGGRQSNNGQSISSVEQLLKAINFSHMDINGQYKLLLPQCQNQPNDTTAISVAQPRDSGNNIVDEALRIQPEGQQNLKSTDELDFSSALWDLHDAF